MVQLQSQARSLLVLTPIPRLIRRLTRRKCPSDLAIWPQRANVILKMRDGLNGYKAELGDAYCAQHAAELAAVYGGWSDNPDNHTYPDV